MKDHFRGATKMIKIRIYPKIPKDRKIAKELQKLLNYNLDCQLKEHMQIESEKCDYFGMKENERDS